MAANAAVTLLCLGFLVGFFLVLKFLERPVLPLVTAGTDLREHESDVRWMHSQLQSFLFYRGNSFLFPVILVTFIASAVQMYLSDLSKLSVLVAGGAAFLLILGWLVGGPVARNIRNTEAYEDDLDTLSSGMFRIVRLHRAMFMAVIGLTFAQLFILFM